MRPALALLLFFMILGSADRSIAEEFVSIEQLIGTVDGVNRSRSPSARTDCSISKEAPLTAIQKPQPAMTYQTVKDQIGEDLKISVLSEERAKELFKRLKNEGLNLKKDCVCAQRAHLMAFLMEREGVESGKLFVKPSYGGYFGSIVPNTPGNEKGSRRWKYHVAPFIFVEKDGKVEPYVFDPLLFDAPVPRQEWEKMLSSHPGSSYGKTQVTRRFIYRPSHVHDDTKGFIPSELQSARQGLYSPHCAE